MTVKHGTCVWQGPDHSDRRTALQNETGGREKLQNKEAFNELNVSWVICSSKNGRKPESLYWFTQSGILFAGSEIAALLLSHPDTSQQSLWIVCYVMKTHRSQCCADAECVRGEGGFEVKGDLKCLQVTLNRTLESRIQYWMVLYSNDLRCSIKVSNTK